MKYLFFAIILLFSQKSMAFVAITIPKDTIIDDYEDSLYDPTRLDKYDLQEIKIGYKFAQIGLIGFVFGIATFLFYPKLSLIGIGIGFIGVIASWIITINIKSKFSKLDKENEKNIEAMRKFRFIRKMIWLTLGLYLYNLFFINDEIEELSDLSNDIPIIFLAILGLIFADSLIFDDF